MEQLRETASSGIRKQAGRRRGDRFNSNAAPLFASMVRVCSVNIWLRIKRRRRCLKPPMDFDEALGAARTAPPVSAGNGRMQRPRADDAVHAPTPLMTAAAGDLSGNGRQVPGPVGFRADLLWNRKSRAGAWRRASPS